MRGIRAGDVPRIARSDNDIGAEQRQNHRPDAAKPCECDWHCSLYGYSLPLKVHKIELLGLPLALDSY